MSTIAIKLTIVSVIAVTILILTISLQQQVVVFAMHDSNLDVNTWLSSDNSTQLHTIDLNKGPVSSASTTEGGETIEEGEVTDEDEEVDEDVEEEDEEDEEEDEQD